LIVQKGKGRLRVSELKSGLGTLLGIPDVLLQAGKGRNIEISH